MHLKDSAIWGKLRCREVIASTNARHVEDSKGPKVSEKLTMVQVALNLWGRKLSVRTTRPTLSRREWPDLETQEPLPTPTTVWSQSQPDSALTPVHHNLYRSALA